MYWVERPRLSEVGGGTQTFRDKRLVLGDMKVGVDAIKSCWKIKTDCRGINHFGNGIWTNETWVHLRCV